MKNTKPDTSPEMTPEGVARWVSTEFGRTGLMVRVSDDQYHLLMESTFREPLRGGNSIGFGGISDLAAVSRKAFSDNCHVELSTVTRWVAKGMPVLEDGTIPLHAADYWVQRYQQKIREQRSYGRIDGQAWE